LAGEFVRRSREGHVNSIGSAALSEFALQQPLAAVVA